MSSIQDNLFENGHSYFPLLSKVTTNPEHLKTYLNKLSLHSKKEPNIIVGFRVE